MKSLGHSGAEITVRGEFVTKGVEGAHAPRLREQAKKQRAFTHHRLRAPAIVHEYRGHHHYSFTMERVHGARLPFDLPHWDRAVGTLAMFVLDNTNGAELRNPGDVFARKLGSVVEQIAANPIVAPLEADEFYVAAANVFAELRDPGEIPAGYCHGDLTFCNVLATDDEARRLYLIDFLDAPFDTPLLDMVKLRQDTRHGWITLFADVEQRKLDMADRVLDLAFDACAAYRRLYRPLAVLNILRVVPYAREHRVVEWALRELARCTR